MELVIREIERSAVFVEPASIVLGLCDAGDEVHLAAAAAGDAAATTGNARDFAKTHYGPVKVWSPRAFRDRMK